MALHASGNQTWQDKPAIDTPVNAAALERLENEVDRQAEEMAAELTAFNTEMGS